MNRSSGIAFAFLGLFTMISTSLESSIMQERLAGSKLSTKRAALSSDIVAVADVVDIGPISPGSPGQLFYDNMTIRITAFYKSKITPPELLSIYFGVQKLPENISEKEIKSERKYLFFLRKGNQDKFNAIKVLAATEGNIAKVKALIGN